VLLRRRLRLRELNLRASAFSRSVVESVFRAFEKKVKVEGVEFENLSLQSLCL
jgi:hypothetical protein